MPVMPAKAGIHAEAESQGLELWMRGGRLVVRALNEAGCNATEVVCSTSWVAMETAMASSQSAPRTPLNTILADIAHAIQGRTYYAALVTALTIPEICSALESEDGWGGSDGYKAWYEANLGAAYPDLTSKDCYALRCCVLHQGRFGRPKMAYARVIFGIPNPAGHIVHNTILDDALHLDTTEFCRDMGRAALKWYEEMANDPNVVRNSASLVRLRPNGLAPYVEGTPIIA